MSRHRRQHHRRARKKRARFLKAAKAMERFTSILANTLSKHGGDKLYGEPLFPGLIYKQ